MAVAKIQGLTTAEVTYVYYNGGWNRIKAGSFKEETESYVWEDAAGAKYCCTGSVAVSNHP